MGRALFGYDVGAARGAGACRLVDSSYSMLWARARWFGRGSCLGADEPVGGGIGIVAIGTGIFDTRTFDTRTFDTSTFTDAAP